MFIKFILWKSHYQLYFNGHNFAVDLAHVWCCCVGVNLHVSHAGLLCVVCIQNPFHASCARGWIFSIYFLDTSALHCWSLSILSLVMEKCWIFVIFCVWLVSEIPRLSQNCPITAVWPRRVYRLLHMSLSPSVGCFCRYNELWIIILLSPCRDNCERYFCSPRVCTVDCWFAAVLTSRQWRWWWRPCLSVCLSQVCMQLLTCVYASTHCYFHSCWVGQSNVVIC